MSKEFSLFFKEFSLFSLVIAVCFGFQSERPLAARVLPDGGRSPALRRAVHIMPTAGMSPLPGPHQESRQAHAAQMRTAAFFGSPPPPPPPPHHPAPAGVGAINREPAGGPTLAADADGKPGAARRTLPKELRILLAQALDAGALWLGQPTLAGRADEASAARAGRAHWEWIFSARH